MKKSLTLCLCAAPSLLSAQPYTTSMAECAGLYQNAAQWVGKDNEADELMIIAQQWADAAIIRAGIEGHDDPANHVWTIADAKTAEWEEKGPRAFLSQIFRDWIGYCESFADHLELEIGITD